MTVIVSTSYMDEAEKANQLVLLHAGKMLSTGTPAKICEQTKGLSYRIKPYAQVRTELAHLEQRPDYIDAVPEGGYVRYVGLKAPEHAIEVNPRLEDSFMLLLQQEDPNIRLTPTKVQANPELLSSRPKTQDLTPVIQTEHVYRYFGNFAAVADVSFSVAQGEIFGLLGPNGAGKTTTFRMLCGLLPASRGKLLVAGVDVRKARSEARRHVGYVAQKFSLYAQLTVRENLEFFGAAYGLRGQRMISRLAAVVEDFGLESWLNTAAYLLPGGIKRSLAMAAGLLHEPSILFLDEPTSGADPLARRAFWRRIANLAAQGVTTVVTTHFMEEAEYCDKILIQDGGVALALGTPAEIRNRAKLAEATIETAFIDIILEARHQKQQKA